MSVALKYSAIDIISKSNLREHTNAQITEQAVFSYAIEQNWLYCPALFCIVS